jgi:hypothetical protein
LLAFESDAWQDICFSISIRKKNKQKSRLDDVIKAMRRGNREGQQEVLGPGFHATNRVHRSKKTYTRKLKHKNNEDT